MKILHSICLVLFGQFLPLISRNAHIIASQSEKIASIITAHIVCIKTPYNKINMILGLRRLKWQTSILASDNGLYSLWNQGK